MNKPLSSENLYVPVDEVAARYSVSNDSVWRWCRKGQFPKPYHPGGSTARWKVSEIEEYESTLVAGMLFGDELDLSDFFDRHAISA